MRESLVTRSGRAPLATGVVLLLALLLLSIFGVRHWNVFPAAPPGSGEAASPSTPGVISATEAARRAAIAALGPIKKRPGVNAADLYADAWALFKELTPDEKKMLTQPLDKLDPAAAAALYAKLQPIMAMLRRARNAGYVDWSMGPLTLGTSMTGRLQEATGLKQAALWESTYRFQSDPDGAAGDLAALVALGRDEADMELGLVLENSFRTSSINLLSQNAGAISSAAAPDVAYIVSQTAAQQSFQNGMNGEIGMLQDALAHPPPLMAPDPPMTPAQFASAVQFLEQNDEGAESAVFEPQAQYQQWWTGQQAGAAALPVVGSTALQGQDFLYLRERASLEQNALLSAGIALEQGDESQLQSIVDPLTGQPFTVTRTATGFQIASTMQYQGKPVTLNFPAPAAK